MKIFISVDIEGVACVTHGDHTKMEGLEYEMARKWMTAEANAAIEGALEAGATEVVVVDAHGFMRNLLPDELHEDALLVSGIPRPLFQMEGLDDTFKAVFLIGYHARAGDALGILSHTHVGSIVYQVRLNNNVVGEVAFNAAVAGHFGVPLALVAGDDTLDAEVGATHPWTERVITKWAVSSNAARNLTPKASQKRIRAAATRAIERLDQMKVTRLEAPIQLEVTFLKPIYAQLVADIPGAERVNGRTIKYTGQDMVEISRIWRLMINAALSNFPV